MAEPYNLPSANQPDYAPSIKQPDFNPSESAPSVGQPDYDPSQAKVEQRVTTMKSIDDLRSDTEVVNAARTYFREIDPEDDVEKWSDKKVLNKFMTEWTWRKNNTWSISRDLAGDRATGNLNPDQIQAMNKLDQAYDSMPSFWDEGGRGFKEGLMDWVAASVADPINVVGAGVGGQLAKQVAKRVATNFLTSTVSRTVMTGVAANALVDGTVSAAVELADQSRLVDQGYKNSVDYGLVGTSFIAGTMVSGAVGAVAGLGTEAIVKNFYKQRDMIPSLTTAHGLRRPPQTEPEMMAALQAKNIKVPAGKTISEVYAESFNKRQLFRDPTSGNALTAFSSWVDRSVNNQISAGKAIKALDDYAAQDLTNFSSHTGSQYLNQYMNTIITGQAAVHGVGIKGSRQAGVYTWTGNSFQKIRDSIAFDDVFKAGEKKKSGFGEAFLRKSMLERALAEEPNLTGGKSMFKDAAQRQDAIDEIAKINRDFDVTDLADARTNLIKFNNDMTEYMRSTGLIGAETAAERIAKNSQTPYMPIQRTLDDPEVRNLLNVNTGHQGDSLEGILPNTRTEFHDPYISYGNQIRSAIQAGQRNLLFNKIAHNISLPEIQKHFDIGEVVDATSLSSDKFNLQSVVDQVISRARKEDPANASAYSALKARLISQTTKEDMIDLFSMARTDYTLKMKEEGKDVMLTPIWQQGDLKFIKVKDPDLMNTMQFLGPDYLKNVYEDFKVGGPLWNGIKQHTLFFQKWITRMWDYQLGTSLPTGQQSRGNFDTTRGAGARADQAARQLPGLKMVMGLADIGKFVAKDNSVILDDAVNGATFGSLGVQNRFEQQLVNPMFEGTIGKIQRYGEEHSSERLGRIALGMLKSGSALKRASDQSLGRVGPALDQITDVIEMAPRQGQYDKNLERLIGEYLAANPNATTDMARDAVTMRASEMSQNQNIDFRIRGAKTNLLMDMLNLGPFFRASVNANRKFWSHTHMPFKHDKILAGDKISFDAEGAREFVKFHAMNTIPLLAIHRWNTSEENIEDYKRLDPSVHDRSIVIAAGDGQWYKERVDPPVLLFYKGVKTYMDLQLQNTPSDNVEGEMMRTMLGEGISSVFNVGRPDNITDFDDPSKLSLSVLQALLPPSVNSALTLATGKNGMGNNVIPNRLDNAGLPPEEQVNPNTSTAARMAGEDLGVSPLYIQEVAQQLVGPLFRMYSSVDYWLSGRAPETEGLDNTAIFKRVYVNNKENPSYNSTYTKKFYEYMGKYNEANKMSFDDSDLALSPNKVKAIMKNKLMLGNRILEGSFKDFKDLENNYREEYNTLMNADEDTISPNDRKELIDRLNEARYNMHMHAVLGLNATYELFREELKEEKN